MSAALELERDTAKSGLTNDQKIAKLEILSRVKRGGRYVLKGEAGTGKTYSAVEVAKDTSQRQRKTTVVLAPTHNAVGVIARKVREAGLDIPCMTAASFLSLQPKPGPDGRRILTRRKFAEMPKVDVVLMDEGSMVGEDLWRHADRLLRNAFILVIADYAQLPPVGEQISPTAYIEHSSTLREPVRQSLDNPVLDIARTIRTFQDTDMPIDWDWLNEVKRQGSIRNGNKGVFAPFRTEEWMKKAFTSDAFKKNNDEFRYLCFTNRRVAQVNAQVRYWIYGETEEPFAPGERILIRQPILRDETVLFNTNEEAPVASIGRAIYKHRFKKRDGVGAWEAEVPCWQIELVKDGDETVTVYMPSDDRIVSEIEDTLRSEALMCWKRWEDFYTFQNSMARLQALYAMTTHTAQGATHGVDFVDIPDIDQCGGKNMLMCKQLLYTAASRASQAIVFVGF